MTAADRSPARRPAATYRLQLGPDFGFDDAAAVVPYLAELGITHLYLSPAFAAAPGSTHGYDVVDPRRVNPVLGGEERFRALCRVVRSAGMGVVIDLVPNHMASGPGNEWWWDVLQHGPASRHAGFFDVDWNPPEERLRDVILLPILGNHYGRELERGTLQIQRNGAHFTIGYHEHVFPMAPRSLRLVLADAAERAGDDELGFLADAFTGLPDPRSTDAASIERRYRDNAVLVSQLRRLLDRDPAVVHAVDAAVRAFNRDPDRLDQVLDLQNYRLAFWRTSGRELSYRRFFDIDTMVAVRVESEEVFRATHDLVIRLVADGCADGLRIDHVDGLRAPQRYLDMLNAASPDTWIVVEKILEPSEHLCETWPVAGTTGYDFLNLALGVLIDPRSEAAFDDLYRQVTGDGDDFATIAMQAKEEVMRDLLGSDVARITQLLLDVCEGRRRFRDHTRHALHEAIKALLGAFPVYRTYVDSRLDEIHPADAGIISTAIDAAREDRPDLDPELFDLLRAVLLLELRGPREAEFVARFQQVSGAVMAKGVEDTAFYRYHRFIALNEVGGDPTRFGVSIDEFHAANVAAAAAQPARMVTTSTHDTKRSEDVRARLAVLSERPGTWRTAVHAMDRCHAAEGRTLDAPTRYAFHQNLIGAWPIDVERMTGFMAKATKEAKLRTSWVNPDIEYDASVQRFVADALDDATFITIVEDLVAALEPAASINALAQKLLCLTVPGVPDVYQGTEVEHRRLVDPDNRAAVAFDHLADRLAEPIGGPAGAPLIDAKPGVVARSLDLRRRRPDLLGPGAGYRPIETEGSAADHLIAFVRGEGAAVVVPRLTTAVNDDWADTEVVLPPGRWRGVFTNEVVTGGRTPAAELLGRFPVALLTREDAPA
jgi:(1->4)-alpha-D-glucan 1-alpha-D-glucosylmutase